MISASSPLRLFLRALLLPDSRPVAGLSRALIRHLHRLLFARQNKKHPKRLFSRFSAAFTSPFLSLFLAVS